MYILACLCSALATAITIYVTEAFLRRRKVRSSSGSRNTCCASSQSADISKKCLVSEGVQVPDSDGLNLLSETKGCVHLNSLSHIVSKNNTNCSGQSGDNMDNLQQNLINFSASELSDKTRVEKAVQVNSNLKQGEYYIDPNMDYSEVFYPDEVSTKDQQENVDAIADNNKNHEVENVRPIPKQRIRRMSDVIDCLGETFAVEKSGSTSRKSSSSSSPPPTPLSDAGYSSVHSTPSHTRAPKRAASHLADTTDSGVFPADEETTDAGPFNAQVDEFENEALGGADIEAVMPVARDAEEYNMNHPRRGRAVVFNNDTFDSPGVKNRDGSEADVKNLEKLFSALDFEITVHHNKEYKEIMDILHNLSQENHSDADCIVVTVLTHGMGQAYIYSKDVPYSVDYLWKPFTANKCKTLAGKPKIFIVQACRGDGLDSGVKLVSSRTQTDSAETYKIPTHADFLIAYSSAEGFYSWRNTDAGTWFIQCLCKEILENAATTDLLKMLTRTARRVATQFESCNDIEIWQHGKKQVPSVTSMLIRDIYFRSKK